MTDDTAALLTVLVNDEQQYGIYPEGLPVPPGWRSAGFSGSEADCTRHVDTVWIDMRPLSLRAALDSAAVAS